MASARTESSGSRPAVPDRVGTAANAPRTGRWLLTWMGLVVLLNALTWLAGFRGAALRNAVEAGAAQAEAWAIGEVGNDAVRKAVQAQRDTLPFWGAVIALDDFVLEPLALAIRAVLVGTAFAGLAALSGRPVRFQDGLAACIAAQGFWVLGTAVRLGLMVALQRPDAETSATLLLPEGPHSAAVWLALSRVEAFAAVGWCVMAVGGWRRGQVNLMLAVLVCAGFWLLEAVIRIGFGLLVGAGMRLSVLPP